MKLALGGIMLEVVPVAPAQGDAGLWHVLLPRTGRLVALALTPEEEKEAHREAGMKPGLPASIQAALRGGRRIDDRTAWNVRRLLEAGRSASAVARETGCALTTVRRVARRCGITLQRRH